MWNSRFTIDVKPDVDKALAKLSKKNPNQMQIITKKIAQILDNPYHFKPLRGDLSGARRVHIGKSFVLIYGIDEADNKIMILDYDHHDKIY